MKKKIFCKKNIKWLVLFVLAVIYIGVYIYRYNQVLKPDIRYYDKGTVLEWYGLEYTLDGMLYDEDEFLREYNLEAYQISNILPEHKNKFIVVEMNIKKLSEDYDKDLNEYIYFDLYSRYWKTGMVIDGEDILNNGKTTLEELKVGESTTLYKIFNIADTNHNKKVWNDAENAKAWLEFDALSEYQYKTRVKVLN